MNWHKFTLDEWLEQFGAWCDRQGRVTPNRLETNQIYHLMQSVNPTPKTDRYCYITDDEALAINRVLCEAYRILPLEVDLLVLNRCHHLSIRNIAQMKELRLNQTVRMLDNIHHYLAGRLVISP